MVIKYALCFKYCKKGEKVHSNETYQDNDYVSFHIINDMHDKCYLKMKDRLNNNLCIDCGVNPIGRSLNNVCVDKTCTTPRDY